MIYLYIPSDLSYVTLLFIIIMSCVALIFLLSLIASLLPSNPRLLSVSTGPEAYQLVSEKVEMIMAKDLSVETSNPSNNVKSVSDIIDGATSAENGMTKSFSDMHQVQGRQTRSLIGYVPQFNEEVVNTEGTSTIYDNLDYSVPHIRPPIHNLKP